MGITATTNAIIMLATRNAFMKLNINNRKKAGKVYSLLRQYSNEISKQWHGKEPNSEIVKGLQKRMCKVLGKEEGIVFVHEYINGLQRMREISGIFKERNLL